VDVAPGTITVSATCTDARGLSTQASTRVSVTSPPVPTPAPTQAPVPPPTPARAPSPEIVHLEQRLSLHSIYFVTKHPLPGDTKDGLLPGQRKTLTALAADFRQYLQSQPDAHLILGGHTDHYGTVKYNQELSERRVVRVKSFLVQQGIPEGNIDTKAFGKQDNLTYAEVCDAIENNPELTPEERQRAFKRIVMVWLASDRRVDVTLSTTGQTSVRQFPFNSTDALALIGGREAEAAKKLEANKTTKH
jgi:outer membrane protein OmpA-like peptidoglycan-associated protein